MWGGAGFFASLSDQDRCRDYPKSQSALGNADGSVNVTHQGAGSRCSETVTFPKENKHEDLVMTFLQFSSYFFHCLLLAVLDLHC